VTVVPYAEFVARRERRVRVMAELRSEARSQTMEGEVLHGQAEERAPAISAPDEVRAAPGDGR
jgi:hypothetical protein